MIPKSQLRPEWRADDIHTTVPEGAHVTPADVVHSLGGGDHQRGHRILEMLFPSRQSAGRPIPVRLSTGEHVTPKESLAARWGDPEHGRGILESLITAMRGGKRYPYE